MRAAGTSRERLEQASEELGRTQVSGRVARLLLGGFAACLLAVPLAEVAHGLAHGFEPLPASAAWPASASLVDRSRLFLQGLETRLDEHGRLSRLVQPALIDLQIRLGAFDEQVVSGRDGWWYYRPDLEHLLGPGFLEPAWRARRLRAAPAWEPLPTPDPRPVIQDLAASLRTRGIRLVLLPAPVKPMLQPEPLGGQGPGPELANPSRGALLDWAARHAAVLDVAPLLGALRAEGGEAYLRTDTHWRPEALERVAAALAALLEREVRFQGEPLDDLSSQVEERVNLGDVARLLVPPPSAPAVSPERARVRRVLSGDGPFRPDPGAEVLVVGDSFANVYSLASMGWGDGAGLAEQLGLELGRPVDLVAQNAGGAGAAWRALAAELRQGRDRLRGKRAVVWVFSERELSSGDWTPVALETGPARATRFLTLGTPRELSARVLAVGFTPWPGRVPYGDHLTSVRFGELEGPGLGPGDEVLAYAQTLREHAWTEAARWRPGDRVRVRLARFDAGRLGGLARSELPELELEEHLWAEPLSPAPVAPAGPGWPEAAAGLLAALAGALVGVFGWRREETA